MTDDEDGRSPIIVEDDALRGGFTQIPNSILRRTDINTGAKLTYMGLLSFAWQGDRCFPGQPRLAEEIGISPRAVWGHLQQLEERGLIAIQQRGQGKTNIYTILRIAESASLESHTSASQESQNLRTKNTQRKDPKKKMQISNFELPTPMKRVQPVTPEFKTAHPDLWQAGCSSVAEFIRVVGRGLYGDEKMNVRQWQAHADAKRLARK